MENYIAVGDWIMHQIETKRITKSMVYQGAGITQSGFLKMIRNNSIKVDAFMRICEAMAVHPCQYFEEIIPKEYRRKGISIAAEPPAEYSKEKITVINDQSDLVDFQQRQIEKLTDAVNTLSNIISNINK